MIPIRIGFGYDTHRLETGRKLMLGGIEIPHEMGLKGHSDADVLLHAICDAMLGALNLRDIGYHFPNTDPQYKDADSRIFVTETLKIVKEYNFGVGNIDCTIVAERPKLNPHIPRMQEEIARLLSVEKNYISIKATTNEKMDDVGDQQGMIAYAVITLYEQSFYDKWLS